MDHRQLTLAGVGIEADYRLRCLRRDVIKRGKVDIEDVCISLSTSDAAGWQQLSQGPLVPKATFVLMESPLQQWMVQGYFCGVWRMQRLGGATAMAASSVAVVHLPNAIVAVMAMA